MEILDYKLMFTEELVKNVVNAKIQSREKRSQEEVHIGVENVRNKKGLTLKSKPFKIFYLALSYFLKGLPPKYFRR